MIRPTRTRFASHVFVMLTMVALFGLDIGLAFAQTDGAQRQAGIWQQTQMLLALEAPRVAPPIASAARASIGRQVTSDRVCIPASAVSRDTLATRLHAITPTSATFRWSRLDLSGTRIRALGTDLSGSISVEGKVTPILTDITTTSQIADPVIGPARRVQRTIIARLGPC